MQSSTEKYKATNWTNSYHILSISSYSNTGRNVDESNISAGSRDIIYIVKKEDKKYWK